MTYEEWRKAASVNIEYFPERIWDAAKADAAKEIEELKQETVCLRVGLAERDLLFDETVEAFQRIVANLQDRGSK